MGEKKCIPFIFSVDGEAEQSEWLLHYSYRPPMRPFASSARLHLRGLDGCAEPSEAERRDASLETTGTFHTSNQRDKKQTGFTSTVPIPVLVQTLLFYRCFVV